MVTDSGNLLEGALRVGGAGAGWLSRLPWLLPPWPTRSRSMYKIHNAPWSASCKGAKPLAEFAAFIRDCAEDKVTRSMTATTTVLALAQIAGPSMLRRPPGFLLVNAGGLCDDPLAHAVQSMAGLSVPQPGGLAEEFERNRRWMIKQANDMISDLRTRTLNREVHAYSRAQLRHSRELAFGGERSGYYSRAPVTPDRLVMATPWFQSRLTRLRQRLGFFPDGYEFFVRQLLLELGPCCERLAWMSVLDGSVPDERSALLRDLHALTFHGICLSLESLVWHGYGFDPGGGRQEALKVLAVIRGEGTLSRRDMLRKLQ